jgi:uncharacterized protein (DUF305 family)
VRKRLVGLFLIALAVASISACGGSNSTVKSSPTSSGSAVPFDRAFIDAMVPHHQSALAMASAAKKAGLSERALIQVANNIVAGQQAEIDQMRRWREDWFGSSTIDPQGAGSLGLSESEMGMQHEADFSGAEDVDQAFATMMIDHHRGAIRMAEIALERGQHDEIKNLAGEIIAAQQREITIMEEHSGAMQHGE